MSVSATITVKVPLSEAGHLERTRIVSAMDDDRGVTLDLFRIKAITDEMTRRPPEGEARAVATAKKAGLKSVGAPDVLYGIHGWKTGPIELWYQIRAEA